MKAFRSSRKSLIATAACVLALAACGPGPREESNAAAPANVAANVAANVTMTLEAPALQNASGPVAAAPVRTAGGPARRCGWLHNPTPGNWWLVDRDGQWVLGTQGREPLAGMDDMPDMSTAGWVETNGHYGHGCACATITADAAGDVTAVSDFKPKPIKACTSDKALPGPDS
jgi:hypothetical protein